MAHKIYNSKKYEQNDIERKRTNHLLVEFIHYLYENSKKSGSFVLKSHKNKDLFLVKNEMKYQNLTRYPFQEPEEWIRKEKKSLYFGANPRKNSVPKQKTGFLQLVIPCKGDANSIQNIIEFIQDSNNIPEPSYYINNGYNHTFDIVYLLRETVSFKMGLCIRALLWSLAKVFVEIEKDLDFQVELNKLTTNPTLRLPGSYNNRTHKMVTVIYHPKNIHYTYHEVLSCLGYKKYNAKFHIQNMKKAIKKIRNGKKLNRFFLPCTNFPKEHLTDVFIHIKRIHSLDDLINDGYEKEMKKEELVSLYTYFLGKIYENQYGSEHIMSAYDDIESRMKHVIHVLANNQKEKKYLKGTVIKGIQKYKATRGFKNDDIIQYLSLDIAGTWKGKKYINPTKKKRIFEQRYKIK